MRLRLSLVLSLRPHIFTSTFASSLLYYFFACSCLFIVSAFLELIFQEELPPSIGS